jgi:hypothetical protein
MAHFAKITNDNKVEQVIVIANDDCGGGDFPDKRTNWSSVYSVIRFDGLWLQTSYHANFRALLCRHWQIGPTTQI